MTATSLRIVGARENNLADLDLSLPLGKLVVFCGRSGSGKSSLAYDTLHREGQRRYLEAMMMGRGLQRPDVVSIEGLPPTIALDQRERAPSSTETLATLAELSLPISVLFARLGVLHCPACGRAIHPLAPGQIADRLLALGEGTRVTLEAPVQVDGAGEGVLEEIARAGFSRVRMGGKIERIESLRRIEGELRVVVDRVKLAASKRDRLQEAVRLAAQVGRGIVYAVHAETEVFVDRPVCAHDGTRVPAATSDRFRLGTQALDEATGAVRLGAHGLEALRSLPVCEIEGAVAEVEGAPEIRRTALADLARRVRVLTSLGLAGVPLGRAANELSRGELLRVRLARLLSSGVSGALFILDEPAAGLDEEAATAVLHELRRVIDEGNSVLVVEHHPVLVRAADHLVEFGPGSGAEGGRILYQGPPDGLADTPTALALAGLPIEARPPAKLREIGVQAASPGITVISGPTGSGKSRLLSSLGEGFERVLHAGNTSIARAKRSSVATTSGVWTVMRDLLAQTREAKVRGFSATSFSLNAKGGRCETCAGLGAVRTVLDPLPDVWDRCPACLGLRFQSDVLTVRWKGHDANELLDLSVSAAFALLSGIPKIERTLRPVLDVGLGHVQLGRPTLGLSGGEMRRLKLARELSRMQVGCLVLADDPSLGLHPLDTVELMSSFARMSDRGATVVLASNDPVVLARADQILPC